MKNKITLGVFGLILSISLFSLMGNKEAKKLASSDKYKVIRVDGRIIFQRTNKDMKKGDIFLSGTELAFKSPEARAAVISSLKGRFVLSASEKGKTKILPAANNISSRSGALLTSIDLQKHFSGDYLVVEKAEFEVGSTFPLDQDHFFYLSYEHNGEKIRKKLEQHDNKFVIDKEEIFKIDGEPIEVQKKEMTLFYRGDGTSEKISTFMPVFPDLDELKDEVTIILEEFENRSDDEKVKEVSSYLEEFYGKTDKDNLGVWLEKEFGLNK